MSRRADRDRAAWALIDDTRPRADGGGHVENLCQPPVADPDVVAVTASAVGGVLLFLVGLAFLGAAVWSWSHRPEEHDARRTLGITIDLLVGVVAVTDAAISVVDEPARLALWIAGSVVLVVALVLLRLRRRPRTTPRPLGQPIGHLR